MILFTLNHQSFNEIIEKVETLGLSVGPTKELNDAIIKGKNSVWSGYQSTVCDDESKEFIKWFDDTLYNANESKTFGPYDSLYYMFLINEITRVSEIIKGNEITRQAVIHFPQNHCFNSIQFMMREGVKGKPQMMVSCSMRSCNVRANLKFDMDICYYLASRVISKLNKDNHYSAAVPIQVTMVIGSLHSFVKK